MDNFVFSANNQVSISKFNIALLVSVLYLLVAVVTKNSFLLIGFIPIIAYSSYYDIRLGLMLLIIILPFQPVVGNILVFHSFSAVFMIVYLAKVVSGRESIYKSVFGIHLSLLIIVAIVASFISGYFNHILASGIFFIYYFIAFSVSQQIIKSRQNVFLVTNALILSGILMSIFALVSEVDDTLMAIGRVGIGENVRPLANTVAIAIVMLISIYQKKYINGISERNIIKQVVLVDKIKWLLVVVLSLSLMSTVSRGVIISVLVFIISLLIIITFSSIGKYRIKSIVKGTIKVGVISLILTFVALDNRVAESIIETFNINTDVINSRFSDRNVEDGSGIRLEIWRAGMSGLQSWEYLYGYGILSFRELARKNGYDHYSHSVFVDTFVTTGLIGICILLSLFIHIIYHSIRSHNVIILSIVIFVILNYITHGDMLARGFWLLLAICIGLVSSRHYIYNNN